MQYCCKTDCKTVHTNYMICCIFYCVNVTYWVAFFMLLIGAVGKQPAEESIVKQQTTPTTHSMLPSLYGVYKQLQNVQHLVHHQQSHKCAVEKLNFNINVMLFISTNPWILFAYTLMIGLYFVLFIEQLTSVNFDIFKKWFDLKFQSAGMLLQCVSKMGTLF